MLCHNRDPSLPLAPTCCLTILLSFSAWCDISRVIQLKKRRVRARHAGVMVGGDKGMTRGAVAKGDADGTSPREREGNVEFVYKARGGGAFNRKIFRQIAARDTKRQQKEELNGTQMCKEMNLDDQ